MSETNNFNVKIYLEKVYKFNVDNTEYWVQNMVDDIYHVYIRDINEKEWFFYTGNLRLNKFSAVEARQLHFGVM